MARYAVVTFSGEQLGEFNELDFFRFEEGNKVSAEPRSAEGVTINGKDYNVGMKESIEGAEFVEIFDNGPQLTFEPLISYRAVAEAIKDGVNEI
jgi:hypothetical protein